MSLLIKALENAEKNKHSEKNKQPSKGYAKDDASPLELSPIEPKQSFKEASGNSKEAGLESVGGEITQNNFLDSNLTLEQEAGLSSAPVSPSKSPKKKSGQEKVISQSSDTNKPFDTLALKSNSKIEKATPLTARPADASTFESLAAKAAQTNQQAAAKVFVANQPVKNMSSKTALVVLAIAGAFMIWLGLQGYSYIKIMRTPEVVVVRPQTPIQPPVATIVDNAASSPAPAEIAVATIPLEVASASSTDLPVASTPVQLNRQVLEKDDTLVREAHTSHKISKKIIKNSVKESLVEGETLIQTKLKRTDLKLTSNSPSTGVDPTLLSAYEAFTRGDDKSAQQQYREVLQRDVQNIDALLGMAAIAQRQVRGADAVGWYQKVLEIEPRNTIAQSALASTQSDGDNVGAESRIKNMLVLQPNSASLHAALGNQYAEQSQWSAAQEAYFNASRLAPNNADYAFNLAISLDQLGKKSLALEQYRRALELLNKSGGVSPDRTQLETRIQALQ